MVSRIHVGCLYSNGKPPAKNEDAAILILFSMPVPDIENINWLDPWIYKLSGLENELRRELSQKHVLSQCQAIAMGRRTDNDDVLFYLPENTPAWAVVHLTWQKENSANWPYTETYQSIEEFIEKRMKPDHQEQNG